MTHQELITEIQKVPPSDHEHSEALLSTLAAKHAGYKAIVAAQLMPAGDGFRMEYTRSPYEDVSSAQFVTLYERAEAAGEVRRQGAEMLLAENAAAKPDKQMSPEQLEDSFPDYLKMRRVEIASQLSRTVFDAALGGTLEPVKSPAFTQPPEPILAALPSSELAVPFAGVRAANEQLVSLPATP